VKELQEKLNMDGRWRGGERGKSVLEIANEAAAAAVKKEREERDRSAKEQRFERWAKENEEREQREKVNREIEGRIIKALAGDAQGRESREKIERQIEEGVRKGFEGLNCAGSVVPNNHNCGPHYGFYSRNDGWNCNGQGAGSYRRGDNGGIGNRGGCIGGGEWNDWNALPGPYRQGLLGGATNDPAIHHRINMLELKFELEKTKNEIRGSTGPSMGAPMGRMWP